MGALNLATSFLEESGESLALYDGFCLELVNDVTKALGRGAIVYIEPEEEGAVLSGLGPGDWGWHAAALIDGLVHDPWLGPALPLEEYVARAFPGERIIVDVIGEEEE